MTENYNCSQGDEEMPSWEAEAREMSLQKDGRCTPALAQIYAHQWAGVRGYGALVPRLGLRGNDIDTSFQASMEEVLLKRACI